MFCNLPALLNNPQAEKISHNMRIWQAKTYLEEEATLVAGFKCDLCEKIFRVGKINDHHPSIKDIQRYLFKLFRNSHSQD